jgi:hypothetical protein
MIVRRDFLLTIFLAVILLPAVTAAQTTTPPPARLTDPKAEAVVTHAVEVLGGDAYLKVQTVIGRGFFTSFKDGVPQDPVRFLDYISYPDSERTEFTSGGVRTIQTNTGDTGWLFDGASKTLSDMKGRQIEDFKRSMRTSVETLLRGWWQKENAQLVYVGRREAGLARRNETVRLTYPDGFWVEYEFAAKEGLPAKVIYKTTKTKADTNETEELTEEDRLAKPIAEGGVTAPWVIDHFINGAQTSRIGYESIEYNRPLPETLWAKPANIKGLK